MQFLSYMTKTLKVVVTVWLLSWCLPSFAAEPNLDLAQYRGKVVYLDFWASWCGPCRQSFPWMNAMEQKYGTKGLVIVAVNVDEQHADAIKFLDKIPASFQIVFDPKGTLAEQYDLIGMPSSFIIDRDGHIHSSHKGFYDSSGAKFEEEIRSLLGK
jgi:cytochrome c biogenesis protein CcmG/thiol:disulfide interchange protein DsbE